MLLALRWLLCFLVLDLELLAILTDYIKEFGCVYVLLYVFVGVAGRIESWFEQGC